MAIILPQPTMSVEKFSFEDGELLVVEVQPSEFPPVRYRGRIWVRVGPRKSTATEAEEKILMERRLSNIHTFDAMPCRNKHQRFRRKNYRKRIFT